MRREREEQYMVRIERCINDQINSDYGQRSTIQLDGKLTQKQKDSLRSYYMALRTGNTITKSRRKAKSYATFYEYMRHLRRFGLYLKKDDYSEANLSDAEGFIELHSSHSQTVSNSITKTLKCFYAWLGNRKKLDFSELVDTLGNMKFNKSQIERLDQNKLLNDSDILKLLNATDTVRDKAIIAVLSESGCRVGELIDLNLENVSFDSYGAFIDIQESKTKERKIRLIISEPYLKHYINQHGFKHKFESPLFYSMGPRNKGQRITMAGVSESLKNELLSKTKILIHCSNGGLHDYLEYSILDGLTHGCVPLCVTSDSKQYSVIEENNIGRVVSNEKEGAIAIGEIIKNYEVYMDNISIFMNNFFKSQNRLWKRWENTFEKIINNNFKNLK
ncbi:tyrosine-type recombinase/integrase [Candidatus Woesearchaeota archaeon]|nr:tyrosine-type recombinase/integrase [Candidatus Woesearchaeota archaeon]MBT7474465.1 tyrosine-type recombinase/integrase [Candidatus Woesearchaeota archaeon]